MDLRRRHLLAAGLAALAPPRIAAAAPMQLDAPNFIEISPMLATSGQPTAEALQSLASQGFQAVVYLAPSTVPNAVSNESELLSRQGIEFVHIPINFGAPDESHVEAVAAALKRLRERKVLVHCEINMRASSMVFLYRVIELHEPPAAAYEAVARVWSPRGVWRRLIVEQLARHRIAFDPY